MSQSDLITLPKLISKIPKILFGLPRLLRGLKIANSTDVTEPVGLALCVEKAARENPNGLAIVQDDIRLSYAQFNTWANKIAHYLLSIGIKKGDCVILMLESRPALLACTVGCAKVGAVSAMVNISQRRKVLAHSINLVNPKLIFLGEELLESFNEIASELSIPTSHQYLVPDDTVLNFSETETETDVNKKDQRDLSGWNNLSIVIENAEQSNPDTSKQIFLNDPCFYIYTSGTTGMPKAVVFNHGRFMKSYGGIGYGVLRFNQNDNVYISLPFYHSTALAVCWGGVLSGASTLVIARKFSASQFWHDVRRHNITAFGYVGELCRYLLNAPEKTNDADNNVRMIFGNGLRSNIWKPFKQRFKIKSVMELYASSEGNVAYFNLLNFDNTVGYTTFDCAIVNYQQELEQPYKKADGFMQKVKKGDVGLLLGKITPQAPFNGYTDASKTEKCILRNVFVKGDAWFNTGDLMRDLGYKHAQFVDRTGDTFRWKGENVSTSQVELTIDQIENISESIVYGVEIPNTNGRAGMASIQLTCDELDFSFDSLSNYLQKELPDYAVPVFIRLRKKMDTTSTFKHLKSPLKQQGFDLQKTNEKLYVLLPKEKQYLRLTEEIQKDIEQGFYRF